jgi:hypothetical protein
LLRTVLTLTEELICQSKLSAAAVFVRGGGSAIAQRGSEYFRQLAAKRKIRAGGTRLDSMAREIGDAPRDNRCRLSGR